MKSLNFQQKESLSLSPIQPAQQNTQLEQIKEDKAEHEHEHEHELLNSKDDMTGKFIRF